jgi:AcrR family transcriptional regulator
LRVNKKERILDVAARHFSAHGFDATSLEDVAAEAGVTKPAIYYHFKDKLDLYESVLTRRLDELADTVEQAVPDAPSAEQLRHYIEAFGGYLRRHPCFAAMLSHAFSDNGFHMPDAAVASLARTLGIVTRILNEGVESGDFEIENPMVVQMMIVSSLIIHQTTDDLRRRVASQVEGYRLLPDPAIDDLAKILARNILKMVRKERPCDD